MPILEMEIEPEGLKDKISDAIRDAILRGDLRPGEKLVELELMKTLGVSRAPLRDAFWLLEKQGYVRMVPHKGTSVIDLSLEEVKDIYAIRAVLEAWVVALAKKRAQSKDLRELRRIYREMDRTARNGDLIANFRVDLEFHQTLWQLSGNRKLEDILNNICPSLFSYLLIRYQGSPSVMLAGLQHHLYLIELIASNKDAASIEREVRMTIGELAQTTEKFIK
jgi:DNA-binding GntR family transcriptional regulator